MKQAAKANAREGVDQAQQQLVACGIVTRWLRKRNFDVFSLSDADAEVVALGELVRAAGNMLRIWEHAENGFALRIQPGNARRRAVNVTGAFAADARAVALHHFDGARTDGHRVIARERLAILRRALTSDDVADLGRGHKIAFVSGVDEFLAVVGCAIARGQAGDARALLRDRFE